MRTTTTLALLGLATLGACGDKDGDSGAEFTEGEFQFTTIEVDDQCYDGAFRALFMPDGEPSDWQYPIELPAFADMPVSYTAQLQEPFGDIEVTVTEAGTDQMTISGAVLADVELDAEQWPGCIVDMTVGVEITVDGADEVHGQATMNTAGFDEDSCPDVGADPCDMLLDFTGVRI